MTMMRRSTLFPQGLPHARRLTRLPAWLLPGLVVVVLALAGCDSTEPYLRDGSWQPNNANDANLHAMVAVPSDLATATPAGPADGGLAAAALDRLRQGRVTPLQDSGLAPITPVASGAPTPAAAAPAAGNNN